MEAVGYSLVVLDQFMRIPLLREALYEAKLSMALLSSSRPPPMGLTVKNTKVRLN